VATIAEVSDRLRAMQAKAPGAATAAALAMGLTFTAEVKAQELTRFSGPDPSPAGSPPALQSGALRNSVMPMPPLISGLRTSVIVGGTVIYARIQELGGDAGINHSAHLPPRPYLKPAVERMVANGQLRKAAVRGWQAVMGA
jgi:hypothetical protein